MREVILGKKRAKLRMGGHVQISGLPTHPTPIIFLAIWSSLGETIWEKKKEEVGPRDIARQRLKILSQFLVSGG